MDIHIYTYIEIHVCIYIYIYRLVFGWWKQTNLWWFVGKWIENCLTNLWRWFPGTDFLTQTWLTLQDIAIHSEKHAIELCSLASSPAVCSMIFMGPWPWTWSQLPSKNLRSQPGSPHLCGALSGACFRSSRPRCWSRISWVHGRSEASLTPWQSIPMMTFNIIQRILIGFEENTRVSLTCILMSAWRARSCDNVARGTNLGTMSVNLDTSTRKWASLSAGTVFLTHAPSCPYPHPVPCIDRIRYGSGWGLIRIRIRTRQIG